MSKLTDEELFLSFITHNDKRAFEDLVQRYSQSLYGYLVRYTRDLHLAQEVFSETVMKVFEKRHLFSPDKAFKPWLFCIAINTAKDKFREKKSQGLCMKETEEISSNACSPLEEIQKKEIGEKISRAVNQLPEAQRQVFIMREYENMSYAEISAALNRPLNTVKSDMRRALKNLRGLLDSLGNMTMEGG